MLSRLDILPVTRENILLVWTDYKRVGYARASTRSRQAPTRRFELVLIQPFIMKQIITYSYLLIATVGKGRATAGFALYKMLGYP